MMHKFLLFRLICLWSFLGIATSTYAVANQTKESNTSCRYLPQFKVLLKKLPTMKPLDALNALDRYREETLKKDSPTCESMEIERLMIGQQIKLVYLMNGAQKIFAQSSEHCEKLDGPAMKCNGVSEDSTAHPYSRGIFPLEVSVGQAVFAVKTEIPDSEIVGAYIGNLGDLVDGKAVRSIPVDNGSINMRTLLKNGSALIVIFRGQAPWIYRKFVWYFD